jgi:LysM repeat protein
LEASLVQARPTPFTALHPKGVHPKGVHPKGVHPKGVHLEGVQLKGVRLKSLATLVLVCVLALVGQAAARSYTVQQGDTLSSVSRRFGVSVADLVAANGLADPNHIRYGATLAIPAPGATAAPTTAAPAAPATHVVQPGEHLSSIAAQHGTTVQAIAAANGLADPNFVVAGSRILLPPPRAAAPQGPKELQARPERLRLAPRFDHWARAYGVPADLMKAMGWYESGWQNDVVSVTGARGIGQLMPATVVFVNQQLLHANLDPKRPDDNIRMSSRFMRSLLDGTGGRVDLALAAYYQGLKPTLEGRILEETKRYVAGVLSFRASF